MTDERPEGRTDRGAGRERDGDRTEPRTQRSRWPGWIWAVPIAALALVVWLGVRSLFGAGATVEVRFDTVAGMNIDADVRYRGLKVGSVSGLALAKDHKHVVATLSLDGSVADLMRTGTRFWIVGASPSLTHPSSLRSIFAGPYVSMDPGPGKKTSRFVGLAHAPAVMTGTDGRRFVLYAEKLGSLARNAPVHYLGLDVGTVEGTRLAKSGEGFEIDVFVKAPYDKLVRTDTQFWSESAISVSAGGGGFHANVASLGAIMSGAIAFATPDAAPAGPEAKPDRRFILFPDKGAAEAAPIRGGAHYVARFDGAVGDLKFGAPVTLRGFKVGRVVGTRLDYDVARHALETPVTIEIDPARLHLQGVTRPADGKWQPVVDKAMRALIAQGLHARIAHNPPVIGGAEIELALEPGEAPGKLAETGGWPEIPASGAVGIGQIGKQAGEVMAKIKALPLGKIGEDLRQTADKLRQIASSPKIEDSIAHLDSTLANIDKETAAARGQIGPLIASLRKAANEAQSAVGAADRMLAQSAAPPGRSLPAAIEELTRAARAVRELADYLDRHPEAIIKGRSGG